jgi:tetratricopeptide (TPR) repeat protein
MIREMLGDTFAASGRLDDAREAYLQSLELEPDFVAAHVGLVALYQLSSRFDLAIAQSQRLAALRDPLGKAYLASSNAIAGRRAEALEILPLSPRRPDGRTAVPARSPLLLRPWQTPIRRWRGWKRPTGITTSCCRS